jgi:hypothetical protein
MNVSVIIPAKNAAGTIGETLRSLVAQTFGGWEAIVVDDGSTDETADVVSTFASNDPRVRLVREPHRGESAARNQAIGLAVFDWLYFLDADDRISPDCLGRLTNSAAGEATLDAVHCGWSLVAPDGMLIGNYVAMETGDLFPVLACRNVFPIHACLVRKKVVESVGAFDVSSTDCEDWDLWQRIARAGARFGRIPDVLVFYHLRPDATWLDAQQYLANGLSIIQRGHSADPRVPSAVHPDGLPKEGLSRALIQFACWPAGMELGRGRDPRPLLNALDGVRDPDIDPGAAAAGIFHGALLPRCQPASVWDGLWPVLEKNVDRFLAALEEHAGSSGLALRVRTALLTMIDDHSVAKLTARIGRLESRVYEQEALIERILQKPWVRLGLRLGLMKQPMELKKGAIPDGNPAKPPLPPGTKQ